MAAIPLQSPVMAETISFRVEDGTTERADALAEEMSKLPVFQGINFTKSRVFAMALARGMDLLEEEYKPKKRGKK